MTIFAKGWALILLAAVMGCDVAMGQKASKVAPVDVAITYDALYANHITGDNFWMQGGAVELGARFYRGWGIAARVEGGHVGAETTNEVPLSLVTTTFGLRYTVASHSGRYVIFGDGLAGETNGFHGLFSKGSGPVGSPTAGTTTSANALAVEAGGGLDIRLFGHFALRAIDARYLRTGFPNSTTNIQNNLSLGAGIVLRLGR
jgi:hypothetical protein